MDRRYVGGVFRYCILYVLVIVGVRLLVPVIGGEYFLHIAQTRSSFSVFTALFLFQEALLLMLLGIVFFRIQRGWKKGGRGVLSYFHDKRQWRGRKAVLQYVVGLFFVYLFVTAGLNALLLYFNISLPGLFGEQMVVTALAQVGIETWRQTVAFVLMIAVVGPFIEELVYRGFFTHVLMKRRGVGGVILAAVLFALAHAEPGVFVNLLLLSLFLGYSYYKTNSLRYPRLFHILINGMAVVVMLTTRML